MRLRDALREGDVLLGPRGILALDLESDLEELPDRRTDEDLVVSLALPRIDVSDRT